MIASDQRRLADCRDFDGLPRGPHAQAVADAKRRFQAVFMEAVAPPGAGQPDAVSTLDMGQTLLNGDGRAVENRVGVVEFGNDLGRIGFAGRIQRDDDRRFER